MSRDGWREPLTLYTATIAAPGERKSAVQAALTDPIVSAEEELAAKSSASRIEAETLRQVTIKDAERARAAASSAEEGSAKDRAKAEAVSAAMAAETLTVPPITRLIADDVTPEAAASLMAEQQRLAIISAEGGVLDTIAGRYSSGIPNLDLWLKGHAGDRLRIDRKPAPRVREAARAHRRAYDPTGRPRRDRPQPAVPRPRPARPVPLRRTDQQGGPPEGRGRAGARRRPTRRH